MHTSTKKKMLYLGFFFSIDSKAFSKTELPMKYYLESIDMPDKKKKRREREEREKPELPTSR
jgi:hypothetical protein